MSLTNTTGSLSEKINFTDDLQTASGLVRGIENIDETHSSGPYPIDDWMPTINMRFDDFDVPAPPAWRKYLQNLYGDFCRSRMILIRMNTLIITIFKMMQYWPL
mgnify:CR=1 FL=1